VEISDGYCKEKDGKKVSRKEESDSEEGGGKEASHKETGG